MQLSSRIFSNLDPLCSEEDAKLREDILSLVEDVTKGESVPSSLAMLRTLMQTSTTSMTSVPKPLKYMRSSYDVLKKTYDKMTSPPIKARLADILSVLALAGAQPGSKECLKYCLEGTITHPGDWGHEYVRQLENEIIDEWTTSPVASEEETKKKFLPLVKSIVKFNMMHSAEIQACDLSMEIDQLYLIVENLDKNNYSKVCLYLSSCANYTEDTERQDILKNVVNHYMKFEEYSKAILAAMQLPDSELVCKCFDDCPDPLIKKQLAFLLARQQDCILRKDEVETSEEIQEILSNGHVNGHFQMLARELDIMEPKLPEDLYKTWLETGVRRRNEPDSARANLAASFVSGFVHVGFGVDKLMSKPEENWVYKNKDHGILSATASLGLIHMWDVDGGLVQIDKYLYANDDYVKAGALLAIGLVNCGVRNECDPAIALLSDYLMSKSQDLRVGSVLGLGLAYAGSQKSEVTELLTAPLTDSNSTLEVVALAALSLGLVNVGSANESVSTLILQKLMELEPENLASEYARFLPLALGFVYMGCRDAIEVPSEALEVLPEPYKLPAQTMLQVCSYAGTGDVLIVQELLRICSEPVEGDSSTQNSSTTVSEKPSRTENKEISLTQLIAALGVGVVGLSESKENSRIFGQIGRYGSTPARRAVPLAIALSSLSDPDLSVADILHKYSHDNDTEVAVNAIFGLGLIGAGTNNARLATMLRQLAAYHNKNPSHLFMVRISQGLIHMGKGTMSIRPLHYASKVLDRAALAGILIVLTAFLDSKNLILGKSHYLMYCLGIAIEPRWIVTLDENLKLLPVPVRVGTSVDTVGKAGEPRTVAGGHVHTTPVLMSAGERAELMTDFYEPLVTPIEGFVILRERAIAE